MSVMTPTEGNASILLIPGLLNTEDLWRDQVQGQPTRSVAGVKKGFDFFLFLRFVAGLLQQTIERGGGK